MFQNRGTSNMNGAKTTTIDNEDVARFSALANDWWDPAGSFASLHRINPARMTYICAALRPIVDPQAPARSPFNRLCVLDVGCGGGLLAEPLTRLGASVTGVDASEAGIGAAREHASKVGLEIEYLQETIENLICDEGKFDAVIASEVIEHVADVALFMGELSSLLRPGGVVVFTTLNRSARSLVLAKILAECVTRIIPRGTHDWKKFLTPEELKSAMKVAGIRPEGEAGIVYSIRRDRFEIGANLSVNYAMHGVKVK